MKRPWHQTLQLAAVSGRSGPGPANWPREAGPALQGRLARHSCAVTGASVCQLLPGWELPSPMPTAGQPDELPVSRPIQFLPLLSPPGRSHCFTFRWMLRIRSAGTHTLTWSVSTTRPWKSHRGASVWLHYPRGNTQNRCLVTTRKCKQVGKAALVNLKARHQLFLATFALVTPTLAPVTAVPVWSELEGLFLTSCNHNNNRFTFSVGKLIWIIIGSIAWWCDDDGDVMMMVMMLVMMMMVTIVMMVMTVMWWWWWWWW